MEIPACNVHRAEIDQAWAIVKAAVTAGITKRTGKRPRYPPRPKRPVKLKWGGITSDLSMIIEVEVDEAVEEEGVEEAGDGGGAGCYGGPIDL